MVGRAANADRDRSEPAVNEGAVDRRFRYRDRWGLYSAIRHALVQRLARTFGMRIYGIYTRPVEPPVGPGPVVPGFNFRSYSAGDEIALLAAAVRPELEITDTFVRSAFAKGDVCDAIHYNGQIVSFQWAAFNPTHDHDGVFIEFGANYRYNYFSYTLPEFRGRHLSRLFKVPRDLDSIARGRTRCIAYISIDNDASMRAAEGNGNRRVGLAGYMARGPLFVAFRTPGARNCPMRFFKPKSSATSVN